MKTIIIDLPPNLSPNGIGLALRAIADDILTGAVAPVPPFHYCVDTAVGTVTFWDVDNDERIAPADNQAHPPLNTPLSAFTPEMLDRLPVGSVFGEGEDSASYGNVEKRADGWVVCGGHSPAVDFGSKEWDLTRPLIRVGPEQASEPLKCSCTPEEAAKTPCSECGETGHDLTHHGWFQLHDGRWARRLHDEPTPAEPAPLPDPWPGYHVEYDDHDGGTVNRSVVQSSYADETSTRVFVRGVMSDATKNESVTWTPDHIREVRTPDGTTLWKRPAAKVTT